MKKTATLLLGILWLTIAAGNAQAQKNRTSPVPLPGVGENAAKYYYDCDSVYAEVWNLYQAEEYEKSLARIDEVISKCQESSGYYEMKAYILIKLKRNQELIETCTQGLSADTTRASLYEIRANTYYFEFEPQKALEDYRQMLHYDQGNARYYNNYLKLLNELRNDDEAIEVFTIFENEKNSGTTFEDEKFIGDIYFYTALAYQRKTEVQKAVELLTEALSINPHAQSYLHNRGLFLDELGQYDAAIRDFSEAIAIDDGYANAFIGRAGAYLGKKDWENARKDFLKALAIGTNKLGVYADLASIYQHQKDYPNAKKYYETYIAGYAENVSVLTNYAYTLFELDENAQALDYFQKAYALDKKEIDILVGLAALYHANGDKKMLKHTLKEIKNNTNFPVDKNLLEKLMQTEYFYSEKFAREWTKIF